VKYREQREKNKKKRGLMASPAKDRKPAPLPAPNSDFYELVETLPAEELAVVMMFAWGGTEGHHNVFNMNSSLLGGSARPSLD
jgi:hypothetical protein